MPSISTFLCAELEGAEARERDAGTRSPTAQIDVWGGAVEGKGQARARRKGHGRVLWGQGTGEKDQEQG